MTKTFDEVALLPHGTIIRRSSWPLHRWIKIVGSGLPGHSGVGRLYEPSPIDFDQFGEASITGNAAQRVLVADALARDWEAMSEPPVAVADDVALSNVAIQVEGRLVPLAEMPASHHGYRVVSLLVRDAKC